MWYALLHHAAAEVLKISIYIYIYMKNVINENKQVRRICIDPNILIFFTRWNSEERVNAA